MYNPRKGAPRIMRSAIPLLALLALSWTGLSGETIGGCLVTSPPEPYFVPPAPFKPQPESNRNQGYFDFGTSGLWAMIHTRWKVNGPDGNKLPYSSVHYDWRKEPDPRMVVTARKLDSPAPLVWAGWVNGAGSYDASIPGFMVTRLKIPQPGCWEITA